MFTSGYHATFPSMHPDGNLCAADWSWQLVKVVRPAVVKQMVEEAAVAALGAHTCAACRRVAASTLGNSSAALEEGL
jgi:hypothetical protein